MRILHTSDWHLGKSLYDFSLLDDQQHFLEELTGLIAARRIDIVIIAGDIYDRPVPPAQAVRLYDRFLSSVAAGLGVPVIAIAGNHDSAGRLEFGSALYQASGYYIYGYPKKDMEPVTLTDAHGPVHFWPMPYLHPADVRVLLDDRDIRTWDGAYHALLARNSGAADTGARNVAVAHGFFSDLSGASRSEAVTSDSEVSVGGMDIADVSVFRDFDYVALGHLHAPQQVSEGKARYSGSPLKYSLSEENQRKTVTIVELGEKGETAWEEVPVEPLHDVRTVSGTFSELCDPSFHSPESGSFQDYVFARISGGAVTWPMEKLRVLFPNILGLAFTDTQVERPDIPMRKSGGAPSPEIQFMRFYSRMKEEDMPPEQLSILREALEEMGRKEQ